MNIFLVELNGYNPATASEETLRFATRQLDDFEERIKRAGFVKRDMFSSGTTFGGSRPSFGDIELVNSALLDAEGDLDFLNEYAFDGRDIAVYWGPSDGDYPDSFTRLYKATMEAVLVAREKVTIRVLGNSARVDLPLRDEFYAGTGDVEGDNNLAGKPKPFAFGRTNSVSPVLVNATNRIYQVHNGAINDLVVYDRGKPLTEGTALEWSAAATGISQAWNTAHASNANGSISIEAFDTFFRYSTDKWATIQTGTFPEPFAGVNRVIAANGRFIVVGWPDGAAEPHPILYSDIGTDGLPDVATWYTTNLEMPSGSTGRDYAFWDVTYSPTLDTLVAVGVEDAAPNYVVAAYADGSSPDYWTVVTIPEEPSGSSTANVSTSRWACVEWIGGSYQEFMLTFRSVSVFPAESRHYRSADGITWNQETGTNASTNQHQLLYSDEDDLVLHLITAPASSFLTTLRTSSDGGFTWSNQFSEDNNGMISDIAYIPGTGYYVPYASGAVLFSPDGLSWTDTTAMPTQENGLAAFGGFLVSTDYRAYGPAQYETLADMFDADAVPGLGEYKSYPSGGLFRLGSSAGGQVVADVTVGATAADRTVAQAFVTVMDELGTTFTPKSLFTDGTKGVWFDPSDPSTVFQDAAATIPAGDGDPVGCILDKSGNDYHATQGTAAARPVLRKTGDVWALEFDGVDDFLTVASMSFTGTEDIFFAAGARRYSSSGAMYLWNMGLSGLNASYPGMSIGPQDFSNFIVRMYMADSSTAASRTAGQWGNLGERVVTVSRSDIYLDQVRQGWSSDINQSFAGQQTRNRIGCRDVGFARQAFWKGTIEQIVFLLRDATTQEREDVTQFIGRRGDFGLPTPGDPPFYDDVSVSVLDSIAPYECGFFLDTTEAIAANVLDQIANSVGAYWGDDRNGLFRIEQIGDPATETAVATVRDYDMTEPLERLRTQDRGRGIPFWRVALQYARRYTTLSSDFDASVSDAERLRLSTPFDVESYEDAGVRLVHLLSQELIVDTLLQDATDAITEATRQWDLRSVKRDRYQFAVKIDSATVEWDVGDVIRVEHPRFGLSSGKNFWIIGLQLNPRPQTITVTIWG